MKTYGEIMKERKQAKINNLIAKPLTTFPLEKSEPIELKVLPEIDDEPVEIDNE